jgi:hypothetical protein
MGFVAESIISHLPAARAIAYLLPMMVRAGRVARTWWFVLGATLLLGTVSARAVENVGITARKLIVIDKLAFANKAAVRLFSLDPRIEKGSGTSTATMSATLDITIEAFNQPPISGAFSVPSGFSETGAGG